MDKIGSSKREKEINFLTLEEFNELIKDMEDKLYFTIFNILFFTGIRKGELLALTVKDINFSNNTINIDKTFHKINKKDVITEPKTASSIRKIKITSQLCQIIKEYTEILYKPNKNTRLFSLTGMALQKNLNKYLEEKGIKKMTIHDFRHSHASLLIHKKINILAISKRLGHENSIITLKTYAHLYEDDEKNIINILENLEV